MKAEPESAAVAVQYGVPAADLPAEGEFRDWAAGALRDAPAGAELCIRLVDEAEGRALNRTFRGRDRATNVLAFPVEVPPGVGSSLLGDLAICVPVVLAEAAAQGKTPAAHFAHLTVHGVLHLLGHDHQDEPGAEAMEARERAILGGLGFPDPYRDSTLSTGQHGGDKSTPS